MKIGIIGGVDRSGNLLQEVAEARGHQLELHTGVMGSTASASSLRALIARSELAAERVETAHAVVDSVWGIAEFFQHAAETGAHVATLPPNVIKQILQHPLTDAGLEKFLTDWHQTKQKI